MIKNYYLCATVGRSMTRLLSEANQKVINNQNEKHYVRHFFKSC